MTANSDGTYTLTLSGADAHSVAFTDRPNRDTAVMSTADLVAAWPVMFADSDPNAVLVEHEPAQAADSMVVELSDPALAGDSLSFTAKVLEDEEVTDNLKQIANVLHDDVPSTLSKVSLFIDAVHLPWVIYTCTVQPPAPFTTSAFDGQGRSSFGTACSQAGGSWSYTYAPPPPPPST